MSDPRSNDTSPASQASDGASRVAAAIDEAGERPSRSTVGVYDAPERRPGVSPALLIALLVIVALVVALVIWLL